MFKKDKNNKKEKKDDERGIIAIWGREADLLVRGILILIVVSVLILIFNLTSISWYVNEITDFLIKYGLLWAVITGFLIHLIDRGIMKKKYFRMNSMLFIPGLDGSVLIREIEKKKKTLAGEDLFLTREDNRLIGLPSEHLHQFYNCYFYNPLVPVSSMDPDKGIERIQTGEYREVSALNNYVAEIRDMRDRAQRYKSAYDKLLDRVSDLDKNIFEDQDKKDKYDLPGGSHNEKN